MIALQKLDFARSTGRFSYMRAPRWRRRIDTSPFNLVGDSSPFQRPSRDCKASFFMVNLLHTSFLTAIIAPHYLSHSYLIAFVSNVWFSKTVFLPSKSSFSFLWDFYQKLDMKHILKRYWIIQYECYMLCMELARSPSRSMMQHSSFGTPQENYW